MGALTIANMAIVREVAENSGLVPEFLIIGMRDVGPAYPVLSTTPVYVLDGRSLLSPGGYSKQIERLDYIIDIGAGDSFAEIYGFKRFVFLWLTKIIALARGKPLLLAPQTIGPFTRAPYVQLARLALTHASAVVARDQASLNVLEKLAPKAKGRLAVDVAFALPFEDRSRQRNAGRIRVGVNVSGLLFNDAISGGNRFGMSVDYAQLMRRFIGDLVARPDVEVHLITHAIDVGRGSDDDESIADLIAQEFPQAKRAPTFADPSQAKSYISSLNYLVAGRMHACIAAYSAGVAVVPVAYSRKFSGLFGMLGYDWLVPVTGMTTDEANAYLMDCLDRRAELVEAANLGMSKVGGLLDAYRTELRRLFTDEARRER